jgi:hypothetical protein
MTKIYLMTFAVYILLKLIKFIQSLVNIPFYIFYRKKNLSIKLRNKIDSDFQIIFEGNSILDVQLAQFVALNAFKKMSFNNFKYYNMSINFFYNPKKSFFYENNNVLIINSNLTYLQISRILKLYKKIIKVRSKKKLINLKINKIKIGDLIYDSYLRFSKEPTIEFDDINYKIELFNSISTFIFWYEYFKNNNVDSLIQSHSNYRIGIPGRIALSKKIKVFIVNIDDVYRLNENKKYVGLQFLDYKKNYKRLNIIKFRKFTRHKMKLRFKGGKGFDIPHTFLHGFKNKKNTKNLLKFSNNKNILISLHDFTDSPNAYGNFIFNDFYEWINYLGKFSKRIQDYDWYVKPHPNPVNNENKIIKNILNKYKNFKLIPANTPHTEIIKNISIVLTCRGTIGYEYPYFNVPVILASNLNKVTNYNFAYSANSLNEYRKFLLNIPKIIKNYEVKKNELEEFYFTHYYLHDASNWIINNYQNFYNIKYKKNKIGSSRISSSKILKTFKDFYANEELINKKSNIFINFYKSNKYKLIFNNFYRT